ncbi:uncharacterized protein LOC110687206 [Chenopodium quinoa]|uniref:uncharacterized protein LOC110687206 n=1 Tax=Chenopodium quinoa TaxID=63459 RepID=UPI000B775C42|nr:uncharacterized protein LOC110687206 [Chenopodium quinoa]
MEKGLQRRHTQVKVAYHNPCKTKEVQRYDRMMAAFESICLKASASENNLNIAMELIQLMDIRLDEINVMAGRTQNGDSLTRTPSCVGNNRFSNIKNAASGSKGFESCTKRKEVSPPTEQESYTQDLSSSSTQHVKNPVAWKKANNTCEVSANLQPSTDMAMVDQPLIGKLIPNLFMDSRQVGSTYHNTVGGEANLIFRNAM